MGHCAGGQPQSGDYGHNKVEMDDQRRIQCSFGLSGIILWLRQNEAAATDLEAMGVTKMQILRLAHHQE